MQMVADIAEDPSNIKTKGIVKCVHNIKGRPSAQTLDVRILGQKKREVGILYTNKEGALLQSKNLLA